MPRGKGSSARYLANKLTQHAERSERQQYFSSRLSINRTATDSFQFINNRISWLNDKIAWCKVNHRPFNLYVEERESLIWLTDKVKELCERLQLNLKLNTAVRNWFINHRSLGVDIYEQQLSESFQEFDKQAHGYRREEEII